MKSKRFVGSFIDTPHLGEVRILHDYSLGVTEEGIIDSFGPRSLFPDEPDQEIIHILNGSFLLPSFYDLHLHAPQFLYQGTGLHLPLMQWLEQYAFKAEERIDADPVLARRTYEALARRLKEHGTGAVLLFGTIKEETNLILAEVMQTAGIRAFVGKLSMDISSRKTYVEGSAESSLRAAQSFTECIKSYVAHFPPSQRLVESILTPRFVPTCSDELLAGLGKLSQLFNLRVQSHLAEARDQVDWVQKERGIPDIDVFDRHNLLTPRTVQAHCTYLSSSCFGRLSTRGTGIAHCPLSNAYFSDRPFPLREALSAGVHVGLGTDIAGGYSIDIMNAMRSAVMVSRIRDGLRRETSLEATDLAQTEEILEAKSLNLSINWKESLYLATCGGALALGIPNSAGTFKVGAPFDAQFSEWIVFNRNLPTLSLRVRLYDESGTGIGPLDFFDESIAGQPVTEEMLEKWWCIGDSRNRAAFWIQGRTCYP